MKSILQDILDKIDGMKVATYIGAVAALSTLAATIFLTLPGYRLSTKQLGFIEENLEIIFSNAQLIGASECSLFFDLSFSIVNPSDRAIVIDEVGYSEQTLRGQNLSRSDFPIESLRNRSILPGEVANFSFIHSRGIEYPALDLWQSHLEEKASIALDGCSFPSRNGIILDREETISVLQNIWHAGLGLEGSRFTPPEAENSVFMMRPTRRGGTCGEAVLVSAIGCTNFQIRTLAGNIFGLEPIIFGIVPFYLTENGPFDYWDFFSIRAETDAVTVEDSRNRPRGGRRE
ncbi:hypothetical protein [Psychromarinibacter halotolerans]|uniref:Uncharacterized protein n=1 Tax=Psychromarinibacter halotolerans TaxID=1775175 RepID=A0ABV7GZ63_9RHOB|nr:hypothetical protein [Psychromarinibacter halotolerans]MDF0598147.1 hypothetical protein [Psychromarinibacter halotolerans]